MDDPFKDTTHSEQPFDGEDWRRFRALMEWSIKTYSTVETLHSAGKSAKLVIRIGIPVLAAATAFGYYLAASGWTP